LVNFECGKRLLLALGNASCCKQIAQKILFWQSKTNFESWAITAVICLAL